MASSTRRLSIALIVACQSTQAIAFGGIALFLPLIREDVGMTFSQAGSLAVASTFVYALMQIPAGFLADRFGAKRLFVAGLIGTNALSFGFALLRSYELLVVNQAMSGFFRSLVFAPGLVLISSHFASDRRATAMGLYVAGGFSSNIVLAALGPLLVDEVGWRVLFVGFSLVGLAVVAGYWLVRDAGPSPAVGAAVPRISDLARLLHHPVLWLSGVIQFVRFALVQAIRFWLPTYLVVDKGYSLQVAGLVVAVGAAVTAPSNFVGGWLADRFQRPLMVIAVSLTVLGVSCVLLVTSASLPVLLAVVVTQSIFIQVYFGPLFAIPTQRLPDHATGTVNGFSNFCANVGGLTFAYTLGAVKDATDSFAAGFYSLAVMCVLGLVATGFLVGREPPGPELLTTSRTAGAPGDGGPQPRET